MNQNQNEKLLFLIIAVVILLFLLKSCQTDYSLKDTDKDGFTDKDERDAGTDIHNASDYPFSATIIPRPPLIPVPEGTNTSIIVEPTLIVHN